MRRVAEVFPEFCVELVALVSSSERPDLASQIPDLPVVDRCRCGQDNCAHFYTAPPPKGSYGPGHGNVLLGASRGLVILDVVHDNVVAVEVLDRADVKRALDAALPSD
jgi:hypothetical protein